MTGFDVDQASVRRLETVMDRYAVDMNKSAEYTVNRTLQNIAGWAAHETIKADKDQLARELGATYRATSPKTGATYKRPQRVITPTTLAKARYAASCRRNGRPIPPEPEFSRKVAAMVKSILNSVAFMKAGWLPAFKDLKFKQAESAVSPGDAFGGRSRPGYGGVIPAHATAEGFAGEIYNVSINPRDPGSWPALKKHGGRALDAALVLKERDMLEFLEHEHAKRAAAFNG